MDNRFLTKVQSNLLDKIIIFSASKKKKSFFSWNNWISIFKKELGSISLAPYTNINLKWISDLMNNLKLQNLQKKTYEKIFGFLYRILIYSDRKQISICLGC